MSNPVKALVVHVNMPIPSPVGAGMGQGAYAKPYRSEAARRAALPGWLHAYNNHRHHTAFGGPPASRVPNLAGQNI